MMLPAPHLVLRLKTALFAGTALLFAPLASAVPSLTVGGYATPSPYSSIGLDLADPGLVADFGASFTMGASTSLISESYLDGIDIFWSGLPWGTMSAVEVDLLTNWVNDGGVVIVNNDRTYPSGFEKMEPFLTNFGISLLDVSSPTSSVTPVGPNALTEGPFGSVASFALGDAAKLAVTGPATGVMTWDNDGHYASALVGPGDGRFGAVVVLPDWETTAMSYNRTPLSDGGILARNAWAYAADVATTERSHPVPDSGSVLMGFLAMIALILVRRRAA